MATNLRQRLTSGVSVTTPNDFRRKYNPRANFGYSEFLLPEDSPTGKPMMVLDLERMKSEGFSGDFAPKMMFAESLHNLKNVDPSRFRRIKQAAISDPETGRWLIESYQLEKSRGEKRNFDDWLSISRLDQLIGGFFLAGDPDIPTTAKWDRDSLPFGTKFRKELIALANDLGFDLSGGGGKAQKTKPSEKPSPFKRRPLPSSK